MGRVRVHGKGDWRLGKGTGRGGGNLQDWEPLCRPWKSPLRSQGARRIQHREYLGSCRHPEWYAGDLTKGEPMNVRILLPRAPETIVWPVGVSLPNAGDDIHVSDHLSSLTVSKHTVQIVNGKVDPLTIHI